MLTPFAYQLFSVCGALHHSGVPSEPLTQCPGVWHAGALRILHFFLLHVLLWVAPAAFWHCDPVKWQSLFSCDLHGIGLSASGQLCMATVHLERSGSCSPKLSPMQMFSRLHAFLPLPVCPVPAPMLHECCSCRSGLLHVQKGASFALDDRFALLFAA